MFRKGDGPFELLVETRPVEGSEEPVVGDDRISPRPGETWRIYAYEGADGIYLTGTSCNGLSRQIDPEEAHRPRSARLSGPGRIDTAVAISRAAFPDGARTAYLAGAEKLPDAVTGSSLVGDGPILLVPSCGELPDVVAEELRRLAPANVVALGGEASVCQAVLDAAVATAADGGGGHTRR